MSLVLLVAALFAWQDVSAAYCTLSKRINETCKEYTADNVHSHSLQGITIKVGGATVLSQEATKTTFNWLSGSKSFTAKQGQEMEITFTNGAWSKNVWIGFDWDGDGSDFEYVYRVYPESGRKGGSNDVETVKITVPMDAKEGNTRVRFVSDGSNCTDAASPNKWDESTPMCGTHGTGNIGYAGSVHEFGLNIQKGDPVNSDLKFAESEASYPWGEKEYTQTATSTNSEGAISYSLAVTTGDADLATIDAATGKVTFNSKKGVVVITATQAAWGSYSETTATYTLNIILNYDVTVNVASSPVEGGVAKVDGYTDYSYVSYGETCELTATPALGYNFAKWTKDGEEVSTSATYNPVIKGGPDEELTYTAVFEKQPIVTYTMTAAVAPVAAGAVRINGTDSPVVVAAGAEVTFEVATTGQYKFVGWIDGMMPVSEDNPYVIESASKNLTLTALCELRKKIKVNLSVNNSELGSALYTHTGTFEDVYEGENVVFVATPKSGNLFINWTDAAGNELGTSEVYTVNNASKDLNVKANFVAKKTAPSSFVTFNGTNQYVRIPNSTDFQMSSTEDLSVSMWTKTKSSFVANARMLGYRLGADAQSAYEFYTLAGGYCCTATGVAGTNANRFIDAVLGGSARSWVHIAVVFDRTAGKSRAYINGTEITAASKTITSSMSMTGTQDILIGAGWFNGVIDGGRYFAGDIANVRVYKKSLSASDVAMDASCEYSELPASIKSNCVAAYKLDNEDISATLADLTGRGNDGAFKNFKSASDLKFANSEVSFPWGEKEYTQIATSTNSEGAITYSLEVTTGDADLATIDDATGKVTFSEKIGVAVITATQAAWGDYLKTTATYTLNITRNYDVTINVTASPAGSGIVKIDGDSKWGYAYVQYGKSALLEAEPAIGYEFVRWTKDNEEVTTSASYTIDPVKGGPDEELNYVAEFKVITGVNESELADAKAWFAGSVLNIDGINAGDDVKVYGANGVIVYEGVSGGSAMTVNISGSGLYIVKINGKVFKATK